MKSALCLLADGEIIELPARSRLRVGPHRSDDLSIGETGVSARIDVDDDGRARIQELSAAEEQSLRIRGVARREHGLNEGDVLAFGRSRVLVGKQLGGEEKAMMWQSIVGASRPALRMMEALARVGGSKAPVWISGESGTGKELAARAIHESSPRAQHPFVAVNCAALPDNLLESELFGVERGAYTGAMKSRAGAFAQAHGGTLLLDEVGELTLTAQSKLLRVLELGELQPVGGERTIKVDVRVLCASWRDLENEVEAGRFRHDLLHRLWVLKVDLPPLRERPSDIGPLLRSMLERDRALHLFPEDRLLKTLQTHDWPGNVRELRNCVTRAIAADDAQEMSPRVRGARIRSRPESRVTDQVRNTLERHRGNRRRTAKALGVSRSTLYRWLASGEPLPDRHPQPHEFMNEDRNLAR